MRRLLLCLPLLLGADLPERVDPTIVVGHYVDGLFPAASERTPPVQAQLLRTPNTLFLGVVSGGATRGGYHRGIVATLTDCPQGVCYGPQISLPNLQTARGPALHTVVDLGGEPGPLLRVMPTTGPMSRPVVPIVYPCETSDRSGRRLVLLDLQDGRTQLLAEDIDVRLASGRRMQASEMELVLTWQVWPGRTDHDAGCLHPPVVRRWVLQEGRLEERTVHVGCR